MSQWALFALCVPGHALEIGAICQREALVATRRQVRRDPLLAAKARALRDHAQHFQGGGPIGRVWQTIAQLDWRWTTFATMLDD